MRFWMFFAGLGVLASVLPSAMPARTLAQEMHMLQCPSFTATAWHNEQDGKTGNKFGIAVTNVKMSCAVATAWAKKLMQGHIPGDFASPHEVKGPPGLHCYITADGTGHAWGGTCHTEGSGTTVSSIDWGPKVK